MRCQHQHQAHHPTLCLRGLQFSASLGTAADRDRYEYAASGAELEASRRDPAGFPAALLCCAGAVRVLRCTFCAIARRLRPLLSGSFAQVLTLTQAPPRRTDAHGLHGRAGDDGAGDKISLPAVAAARLTELIAEQNGAPVYLQAGAYSSWMAPASHRSHPTRRVALEEGGGAGGGTGWPAV